MLQVDDYTPGADAMVVTYAEDDGIGSLLNHTLRFGDGRPMFTGLRGEPLSVRDAGRLLGDPQKRCLARTWMKCGRERVCVSTVFLPLDTGFMGVSEKWETMVFGGPLDGYQHRCATRRQAKAGHEIAELAVRISIRVQRARHARLRRMHANYHARWTR